MRDFFIIGGCWAISFLFNGIEAGLTSIDPVRLRHHVKFNRPSAVRLDRLLKTPGHLLVTVLLVTNFADIVAVLLLTRFLVSRFATTGFLLAILIALPIYLFVLVVLPKSLFRRFPFRALSPLARLLEISMAVLWPMLAAGTLIGRLFLPAQKKRARLFAAREELKQITSQSEREGSLTATERAMIHNVVDFQNVTARDVMKPLSAVGSLKTDSGIEDVFSVSRATGFDRLPVIGANGDAVGLVNVLDILLDKDQPQSLSRYMRRMVTVQESELAARAVQRLRAARLGLAAVVDQKRNLIGVVTSEDLIARLVRA
ncbi:MAG TPA: CNNM domain-containing protein [Chthoniobacterales bacterium]|jgi:putative hemolysin|nr:CNNM domain-containing protein [Chthoniobacterales bacterium]